MSVTWPVALYDVVGILVPGVLLLLLAQLPFGAFAKVLWLNLLLALPAAYASGHAVQGASRLLFARVDKWFQPKTLRAEGTSGLHKAVIRAAAAYYGDLVCPEIVEKHLFDLCYSPVADRLDSYKLFIALADFCRALAFLALMGVGLLTAVSIGTLPQTIPHAGVLALLSALLAVLFVQRSMLFRQHAQTDRKSVV